MNRGLIDNYAVHADRYDELLDASGMPRSHWHPLIHQIDQLPAEVLRNRARALQDAIVADGMTYNVYADPKGTERPWELDLLPQILPAEEWQTLAAGVAQRAQILNGILADLYGPQQLLSEGLLPPALIFGQRGYLWPCRGIQPPGGIHLHVYAADLARSPDGQWWIIADRTQGPSGAGYALQNRQILSRALPDALSNMHVQPTTPFFRALQDTLTSLAPAPVLANGSQESPLIVLLTPGPYNETYSEHAFLARTLGFPLVEGADLTVRGDVVFLKTLSGLRRVHAILRRLDDDYCDPLELRADSALGIPGLLQAARAGNVLIANALGSSVLESGALQGFLPAISRRLLGEQLKLPGVATWWCGEAPALEYVLQHLDDLVIKAAFPSMRMDPIFGHALSGSARTAMIERLRAQPHAYVAQEWVRLSQAPVLARGSLRERRLLSRAIGLRLFAAANADGSYTVMPGGLTRVAPRRGKDVVTMQRGGASKDVWVLGDPPVIAPMTLKPLFANSEMIRSTADISARAGENLFWMGRYTERSENIARLLRAALQRVADVNGGHETALSGLMHACKAVGLTLPLPADKPASLTMLQRALIAAITDPMVLGGINSNVSRLHTCAHQVREHLSLDNWHTLHRLPQLLDLPASSPLPALDLLNRVLRSCAGLSGYAMDDMTRDAGWRFLMLGRRLERMTHLAQLLGHILTQSEDMQDQALEWLLESTSSIVTYRARYRRAPEWLPVLYLLVFDASNPHSIAFQFESLYRFLERGARKLDMLSMDAPQRLQEALRDFELQDFERNAFQAPQACEKLAKLMGDAINSAYTMSDDLARHFFTLAGAPVSQGV